MSLTRDQILAKRNDLPRESVEVPGWGEVFVRVLTLGQLLKLTAAQSALKADNRQAENVALVVAASACDEAGTPLFTEADVPALLELQADALGTLAQGAMRLNKLGGAEFEAARKN